MTKCDKHTGFNSLCPECIRGTYHTKPESYFITWFELIGDALGSGPNPENILAGIKETIEREQSMKKMIASLRKKNDETIQR